MALLLQLPSVLVENIYAFLDNQDALHIRLVCRTLRDDVHHPFKNRFFNERTISMTEESLQHLTDLSTTNLVSALRTITFVDHEKQYPNIWSTIRTLRTILEDLDPSQHLQHDYQSQDLECQLKKVGQLEDQLVHVLWNLKNPVAIRFQLRIWARYNELMCDIFSESTACFLRAFAIAGSDVTAISSNVGSIPLGTFQDLLPNFQQLGQCFANLKTLDLSVPCVEEDSDAFVNFLALIPSVRNLGLRFAIRSVRIR
jgi:hypothetical protein